MYCPSSLSGRMGIFQASEAFTQSWDFPQTQGLRKTNDNNGCQDANTYEELNLPFSQFNSKSGSLNSLVTALTFNEDKPGHFRYVWYKRCHSE